MWLVTGKVGNTGRRDLNHMKFHSEHKEKEVSIDTTAVIRTGAVSDRTKHVNAKLLGQGSTQLGVSPL